MSTAAAPSSARMAGEPQPHSCPCMSPSTSEPSPKSSSGKPTQSIAPCATCGRGRRGSVKCAAATIARPIGRLMKNTARQLTPCVRRPPTSGPSARKTIEMPV